MALADQVDIDSFCKHFDILSQESRTLSQSSSSQTVSLDSQDYAALDDHNTQEPSFEVRIATPQGDPYLYSSDDDESQYSSCWADLISTFGDHQYFSEHLDEPFFKAFDVEPCDDEHGELLHRESFGFKRCGPKRTGSWFAARSR